MVSESHRRAELLRSSADSATRVLKERAAVAGTVADSRTRDSLKQVVKPNSISKTLRKAGVALIIAPDPVSAVPGAIMFGASLATKGRQPLSPSSVYDETQRLLDEMGSFF